MKELLEQIEALSAELQELRPLSKDQELRIMQKFRLDWNYHSNHIEGNQLSYGETKALILFGITAQGKPMRDHLEMQSHNEALKYIEEVVKEERPLTEQFIRELHSAILKEPYEVDAITAEGKPTKRKINLGQYKSEPNHVKTKTGEIFRFASPEETPAKMEELIDWFRTEKEKTETNAFLLAAEFHYRFVRIHPFDDGNGRMARILMNFILMQNYLPPIVVKTENKQQYFSALEQADAGSLETLFKFLGNEMIHSLEIMIKGAKGESIEDPDDIDKKIALMQKTIDELPADEITVLKSKEAINQVAMMTWIPLLEEVNEKLEPIKKWFRTCFYELATDWKDADPIEEFTVDVLNERYISTITSDTAIMYFSVILNGFKKMETDNEIGQSIIIEFSEKFYNVQVDRDSNSSYRKYYHQHLNQAEINHVKGKFVDELLEQVSELVNPKESDND